MTALATSPVSPVPAVNPGARRSARVATSVALALAVVAVAAVGAARAPQSVPVIEGRVVPFVAPVLAADPGFADLPIPFDALRGSIRTPAPGSFVTPPMSDVRIDGMPVPADARR